MAKHGGTTLLRHALLLITLIALAGCDSGTAGLEQTAPPIPTMVAPANGATDQANAVALQWDSSIGAETYHVQVSGNPDFSEAIVDKDLLLPNTMNVNGLEIGTTYYWHVRAVNEAGISNWSPTWRFTPTSVADIPSRPSLTYPVNGTIDLPTLLEFEWQPTPDAKTYHIQVSTEPDFLRKTADLEGIDQTTVWVSGLIHTYTYYWRVRAANPAGYGPWSPTWTFIVEWDT